MTSREEISAALREARARTLALFAGLRDDQLHVPRLDIVNPLLWEFGHIAFFAEFWTLRHRHARPPIVPQGEALYDSSNVSHEDRWKLPLPDREGTLAYLAEQIGETISELERERDGYDPYFYQLALHHEDMHAEAVVYTSQTLGYSLPRVAHELPARAGGLEGDVQIPAGTYTIGAHAGDGFAFDNEKWAHAVELAAFSIARAPVTNASFAMFVDAGGYGDTRLWSAAGRAWLEQCGATKPLYWRRHEGRWQRRHFDRWADIQPNEPVVHVNQHEALAYCAWARRRLPTEAEWEVSARNAGPGNLDASGDVCDVGAFADSDSAFGCRQMLGNVWEWTASAFEPYPRFVVDPYKEYSEPWFGTHSVLRGGAWSTRSRLVSPRWRNFYGPQRRDVIAGFRTCAL